MGPLEFLRTVWPDQGPYCIALPFPNGIKGYEHHTFDTIEEAAAYAESIADSKNVFYATHSLRNKQVWDADYKGGKWRVRVQTNMRASRILFLDLDVESEVVPNADGGSVQDVENPHSKYATQNEAFADLMKFIQVTGLPKPMITSSGGGLHVYWFLDDPLASNTAWVEQAAKLKLLGRHYGLKLDPMRTTDTSSVLRVAGTFNHKGNADIGGTHVEGVDPKRPVEVVFRGDLEYNDPIETLLENACGAIQGSPAQPKATKKATLQGPLGNNTAKTDEDYGPPPSIQKVFDICPQLVRIAAEQGRTSHEPEWYATLGVVKFVENGNALCHRISSGHPQYNQSATQDKIDQWASAAGPTSCAKMESVSQRPEICRACPLFKEGKGPVSLARRKVTEQAPEPTIEVPGPDYTVVERVIPNPPQPYIRTLDGRIITLTETAGGFTREQVILADDLYPLERMHNSSNKTEDVLWRTVSKTDGVRDFLVDAKTFVDPKLLETLLVNNGVHTSNFLDLKAYMSAYIQDLKKNTPVSIQYAHLGWIDDFTRFVLPDHILGPDGEQPAVLSKDAGALGTFITTKGTLADQIRLMHFFDDPIYTCAQYFMLSSLGSILMFATGHAGFVISATGESGSAKSFTLEAAASFWGKPSKIIMKGTKEGATTLGLNKRRAIFSNLPTMLDELTNIDIDKLKELVMSSTQANQDKIHCASDGSLKPVSDVDISAIIMVNGNNSLHTALEKENSAGSAAAMRVFEIHFPEYKKISPVRGPVADGFRRQMSENYGHIGKAFVKAVLANLPKVRKLVTDIVESVSLEANMTGPERFYFAGIACNLVACSICNKLGLLSWSREGIWQWLMNDQLPAIRSGVAEDIEASSPLSLVTNYVGHIITETLVHQKYQGGMPHASYVPTKGIKAVYNADTKMMYVVVNEFKIWCSRQGKDAKKAIGQLAKSGIILDTNTKRFMTTGSNLPQARDICFALNMSHPDLAGVAPPTVVSVNANIGQPPALKLVS